jgi:hypothetical protein
MFDDLAKLKSLERELKLRRRNYPRWVKEKKMVPTVAEREIQIFEEIANDYRGKISGNLFAAG